MRKPLSDSEDAASPPPQPAAGRGRGTTKKVSSSDDEGPPLSAKTAPAGRGRGATPKRTSDDEPARPPPRSPSVGRGQPVRPVSDSEDDAVSPSPARTSALAPSGAGRGRGKKVSSEDESSPPPSPSPAALPTVAAGGGRGRGTTSSGTGSRDVLPTASGRGRGAKTAETTSDDEVSPRLTSVGTGTSRGRGVPPTPPPERLSANAGRGVRVSAPPAPVPLPAIALDLSSDDEPWQPPPREDPVPSGRGRGAIPPPAKKEIDPPAAATAPSSGRGRSPAVPKKPDDEPPASTAGRGRVTPVPPKKDEAAVPPGGRGRGTRASGSNTGLAAVEEESSSEEEEEEPLTAVQKRQLERLFEDKESKIRTMDDLLKDLQPNEEELNKAMQLASYLDREQAAEEEEAAPVVQPKTVPYVTKTMSSESTVREAGLPTCLAVRKPWIAIGMTHGVVLVFDKDQKLSGILGTQEGAEYGRVCSLAISNSAKMLLVGHGNGAVVLWDIADGRKPIKVVTDTHKASVIHADFLKDDFAWVTGDVDGRMVSSVLTSMLFVYYHSATEIQTNAGAVLALKSLRPGVHKDATDGLGLCAACTEKGGLIIFSTLPKVRIWKSMLRPESVTPTCIPYVSWREAVNLNSESTGDPILCVGWGTEIMLFRIGCRSNGEVQVVDMGSFSLNAEVTAVTWLGYNAVTILTAASEMKVFDPFSLAVLETTAVENMDIANHTLLGSNYSSGCYSNSVTNQGDSGFMLGVKDLYALRIWSWNDRVRSLIEGKKFLLALATCYETFQLKGKGYLGISADPEKVRVGAAGKIEEILAKMLEHILHNKESTLHDRRMLASVCIRYCQAIGKEQLLFDVIFPMFKKAKDGNGGIFLELLEPFVLQNRLTTMNGSTLDAFARHYYRLGRLQRVEQCLMRMDVKLLDFDQVARLCREHKLASALVYLYNTGRDDYMTPLDFLFESIASENKSGTARVRATGLRILLYISLALQGQRFPTGVIPLNRQTKVKQDILGYLFDGKLERIKTLISFDAAETFRILSVAMEDRTLADLHAGFVDQLQKLMVDPKLKPWKAWREQKSTFPFTATQLTGFFVFLARTIAAGNVTVTSNTFQLMLSHLVLDDDSNTRAERQQAILLIIRSTPSSQFDEGQLHMLAQGAEMYEVSELFYMKQKNYRKVVQCAIDGSKHDKKHVFKVLAVLMTDVQLSDQDRETVKKTTMASLEQLIEVDAEAASMIIMEHFAGDEYTKTVHELDQHPRLQYKLLRGIVNHHVTGEGGARWEQILQDFQMGQELTETYIRLLCEFDPSEVCQYLMKVQDYRHDVCLELVKRHKIEDAAMYLLERTGDLKGAMGSILKALETRIAEMKKAYSSLTKVDQGLTMPEEKAVLDILNVAVGLCQRNSNKEKKDANSQLWFMVLDRMVIPAEKTRPVATTRARQTTKMERPTTAAPSFDAPAAKLKQTFNFLMREVLRQMMTYVALPAILDKIVRDHAKSEFAEFKDVIYNMLETFHYESSILGLANHVLERDMFDATSALRKRRARPYVAHESRCPTCQQSFVDKPSGLLMYPCGHGFHRSCLPKVEASCPICVVVTTKKGKGKDDADEDDVKDTRERGQTMQARAETASGDDAQARLAHVVARYRNFSRSHVEETPKFKMLQLFDQEVTDIYQFTGAKLQLAPQLTVQLKVGRREEGMLQEKAKYSAELTQAEFKSYFPSASGPSEKTKKKAPSQQKPKQ